MLVYPRETVVPLNRPALSLGPGPRSVQDARRWVADTCAAIGRNELSECAELGVSELVTNALLHARPPITVRVRGTREHPRVEVRDGSTQTPSLPKPPDPDDLEELLLTFGRGLSIVARAADAWGVEVEEDGKIVWFNPAGEVAEDEGAHGEVSGLVRDTTLDPHPDEPTYSLLGVPVDDFVAFGRHYRELRREVRLLSMAHQDEYPLAAHLAEVFGALDEPTRLRFGGRDVAAARSAGEDTVDLTIALADSAVQRLEAFMEMLELADRFCREQRLLSLARTPEQREFANWFFCEFLRQHRGEPPRRFPGHRVDRDRHSSVC